VTIKELCVLHIYVDADACPVKREVYRVADRYRLAVTLVANSWMHVPGEPRVKLVVVASGSGVADDWIVEHLGDDDIVVTADIELADRCLKVGALVIGSTGKSFSDDMIGTAMATRDLLSTLRGAGELTGGPPPMTQRDRSQFLQQLDKAVQTIKRRRPESVLQR
jgi:uncharacterized protein